MRCGWHRRHRFELDPDDGTDSPLPYEEQWWPGSCVRCGLRVEINLARGRILVPGA